MKRNKNSAKGFLVLFLTGLFLLPQCGSPAKNDAVYEKVTTFAGLPKDGQKALIKEPFGLAFNSRGILFISDGEAGRIWQADKNGVLTLVTVKLDTSSALAFDKSDNLYVADSGSHTIKKINIADGETSVVAGVEKQPGFADGEAGKSLFNAPVGIAIDDSGRIFVADTYNDRIRMIENGRVSTVAGGERGFADAGAGTEAKFDTPCGIAVTKDGDLLVADTGNGRLRMIEKSGNVSTLEGGARDGSSDAPSSEAALVEPVDVKTSGQGMIYIADAAANTIYALRREPPSTMEKLTSGRRGLVDGEAGLSRFNRPSGIALDAESRLFIADSENQLVRVLQKRGNNTGTEITSEEINKLRLTAEEMRGAAPPRWPFDPPERAREVAGTMGEIRGDADKDEDEDVWFHNGLDVVGAYGETARFVRSEKVLRPLAAQLFGTTRENLRLPTLGYIHLRLGRDRDDKPFDNRRFLWNFDEKGRVKDLRIRRGTKFEAGEPIGTLNSMYHVHLITGRAGNEMNALAALTLPGLADSIAPVIEEVRLYDENGTRLGETQKGNARINVSGNIRAVARAYDRMNGNAARRRLGVYRLGYVILHEDGSTVEGFGSPLTTIVFDKLPNESSAVARLVYAEGSKSGATGETIFNYIVTNFAQGGEARESFLDTGKFPPGDYILRVTAADFFGNETVKDIKIRTGG